MTIDLKSLHKYIKRSKTKLLIAHKAVGSLRPVIENIPMYCGNIFPQYIKDCREEQMIKLFADAKGSAVYISKMIEQINKLSVTIYSLKNCDKIIDMCNKYDIYIQEVTPSDTDGSFVILLIAKSPLGKRYLASMYANILLCSAKFQTVRIKLGYQELSHVYIPDPQYCLPLRTIPEMKICDQCKKINTPKKCARCTLVRYCNRECQTSHWSSHKIDCKKWKHYKFDPLEFETVDY